jgi:hypothetical protein
MIPTKTIARYVRVDLLCIDELGYTKLNARLLRPLLSADQPQAPPGLRHALAAIDRHVQDYINHARLKPAASNLTHMFKIPTPTL